MTAISRRSLLVAAAAAGGFTLAGATAEAVPGDEPEPFDGERQPGILSHRPRHAILGVYDVAGTTRRDLQDVLIAVSEIGRAAMSAERPARLTVTVGLGASLFDRRGDPFDIASRRPRGLRPMPSFAGDRLETAMTDGDLLIQICAEESLPLTTTLRAIEAGARGAVIPRALHRGEHTRRRKVVSRGEVAEGRGLFGFLDGTANPDGTDLDRAVFVSSDGGEPGWTRDGAYLVFRKIRLRLERWDREPVDRQERIMGRSRESGAPLDGRREGDIPRFGDDPGGRVTALRSHVRRANPRTPDVAGEVLLRRSYSYVDGHDEAGMLDAGQLFIAFQADPVRQFEAIKARLSPAEDPQLLDDYMTCVGGGYFFVPHGAGRPGGVVGSRLFAP